MDLFYNTTISNYFSCILFMGFWNTRTTEIYFKDIYVVVTDIEKKQYFAGAIIREVTIEVYSQEYNLTKCVTETYKGMFGSMPYMEYERGDTVKAKLCTAFMESTGQIVNQYIYEVY